MLSSSFSRKEESFLIEHIVDTSQNASGFDKNIIYFEKLHYKGNVCNNLDDCITCLENGNTARSDIQKTLVRIDKEIFEYDGVFAAFFANLQENCNIKLIYAPICAKIHLE